MDPHFLSKPTKVLTYIFKVAETTSATHTVGTSTRYEKAIAERDVLAEKNEQIGCKYNDRQIYVDSSLLFFTRADKGRYWLRVFALPARRVATSARSSLH